MLQSTCMKLVVILLAGVAFAADATVEFNRDIRPILSDKCFTCHGPDPGNRKTALRFDTEAGAQPAIVAGDPVASKIVQRISSSDTAVRMPPAYAGHDKLSDREIEMIRLWIAQGAQWQKHWSFLAPKRAPLPALQNPSWVRNPIDAFVLARLERDGLHPSPEASRSTLIRRVTLDLTGLPPTPAEVDAFLNDASPNAYEKVVDRLLASPRYSERMAVRWLDAARYADTNGYQTDGERSMWRWRDWVIDAFARNMPFDQFTVEQIAGDMLPNATLEQRIATGFHRNHRTSGEGGSIPEELRVEYVADRVETTSIVWMGLTVGCARCHDHKYDPVKQKEFYQIFAFFNNVPEKGLVYNQGNDVPYVKAPTPEQSAKLAELNQRATEAEQQYAKLQPELHKAQVAWERKTAKAAAFDWSIRDGLVFYDSLDWGSAPAAAEQGKIGKAGSFDGKQFIDSGDYAKFNYMDPFTYAAWIKPTAPDAAIVSRMEDYFEGQGHGLFLKDGKLRLHIILRYADIGLRVESEEPIAMDRWQHVAVTYDGYMDAKGVKMYVDGQPRKIKILFDDLNYPFTSKETFKIGAGGGLRFKGLIDDVRVYNIALSPEQAAVLPLLESVQEIARIRPSARTKAQQDKLNFCFLDRFASPKIQDARREMLAAQKKRLKYDESIQTVMVMQDSATPRDAFVLRRGAYDAHGEKVTPGVPAFLPPMREDWPKNRLGLARWLVDPSNPLTARVTVNRFWQMLFGLGLVRTVEDFGSQGEWPVNPALLDWLAVEFMESGWNVKGILKTMVMSATYRQSSKVTPELLQKDPENRLLARGARMRLPAEAIRDQALAISGLLTEKIGGPSVKPYQPPGLWQELAGGNYEPDKGADLYRRSLYTYWRRTIAPPAMVTFDSSNREQCIVRETRTNTPLQALDLMNDVTYVEASRKFAERILAEGGAAPAERIAYGFRLALARAPKPAETAVLLTALNQFETRFRPDAWAAAS